MRATLEDLNESLVKLSEVSESLVCNNQEIHAGLEELRKMYEPKNEEAL
jgi:hypothetical protein